MANKVYIDSGTATNDFYFRYDGSGGGDANGYFGVGNDDQNGYGDIRGAIYFDSVNVARGGCNYAGLYLWTSANGKELDDRAGNWTFRVYAVDEDDTDDLGSDDVFEDRDATTNYSTSTNSNEPDLSAGPGSPGWKEINVTSCVNEVMSRNGWSSGNSIVLMLKDIESGCVNKVAVDNEKSSFLLIRKSAEPNFKPTNTAVAAPTFPSANSYGIRISYPGYDVKTATEDQLYYTSRKRLFKIVTQGKITTTADTVYQIAHGQDYKPFAKAYMKSPTSTKRYLMPRFLPGEQADPDGYDYDDPLDGAIAVDSTYVKIKTTKACEVYYYIFIDELD